MNTVTRRTFVAGLGAAAVVAPTALLANAAPVTATATAYLFLEVGEARFVESAGARLLAHDDTAPGAFGAPVAAYIDQQLAGPWGQGLRPYRTGLWQPGTQACAASSSSPATSFRTAVQAVTRSFAAQGTSFSALDGADQASYLRSLADGVLPLDGVPAAAFFDLLLAMSVEAFFTGSAQAPDRGIIAWPLKGFPGACFRGSGNVRVSDS